MATEVMTAPEGRIIHKTYAVLSGAAIPQRVYVTQYDDSLPVIACTLYKDGQLYTIPDGASVRLRMNKNGLPVYHEAIGIDDTRHVVYIEITAQMTVLYGEFAMVLEVETSDGKTAGTSYLRLIVRQNPVQNPELDNIPDYTANSNRLTAEGVKKLQDESSTQQKAIEDKGKNTLESIPADYSTLSGMVNENTSGISELKEDIIKSQEAFDNLTGGYINEKIIAPQYTGKYWVVKKNIAIKRGNAIKFEVNYYSDNTYERAIILSRDSSGTAYIYDNNVPLRVPKFYIANDDYNNIEIQIVSTIDELNAQRGNTCDYSITINSIGLGKELNKEYIDRYNRSSLKYEDYVGIAQCPDSEYRSKSVSIGLKTHRWDCFWSDVEKQIGVYDVSDILSKANADKNAGMKSYITMSGYKNEIYGSTTGLTDSSINAYLLCMQEVVTTLISGGYTGLTYELWNEPWWQWSWKDSPSKVRLYVEMCRRLYSIIHDNDPSAKVFINLNPYAASNELAYNKTDNSDFCYAVIGAGVLDYTDGVSYHMYNAGKNKDGNDQGPEHSDEPLSSVSNHHAFTKLIRKVAGRNIPIIDGEVGYSIVPNWDGQGNDAVTTDVNRAKYIVRRILTDMIDGYQKTIIFCAVSYELRDFYEEDWFGLWRKDGTETETLKAIKRQYENLNGYRYNRCVYKTDSEYLLEFENEFGHRKYAGWCISGNKTINVNGIKIQLNDDVSYFENIDINTDNCNVNGDLSVNGMIDGVIDRYEQYIPITRTLYISENGTVGGETYINIPDMWKNIKNFSAKINIIFTVNSTYGNEYYTAIAYEYMWVNCSYDDRNVPVLHLINKNSIIGNSVNIDDIALTSNGNILIPCSSSRYFSGKARISVIPLESAKDDNTIYQAKYLL